MEIASLKKQLADKDEELATQNEKLEKLKIYESKYKVKITNGYLSTFLDLIHQFREIRTPNENGVRILSGSTELVWAKMICKYFQHGEDALNIETIRSRFTADKEKRGTKYRPIREKDKFFKIVPEED